MLIRHSKLLAYHKRMQGSSHLEILLISIKLLKMLVMLTIIQWVLRRSFITQGTSCELVTT